ncbi:MAG: hypothetical protein WEC59_07680 [Salibacteraceae bacterium]
MAQERRERWDKNQVALYYPIYKFFDSSPVVWKPYSFETNKGLLAFGVSYMRQFKNRFGLLLSSDVFAMNSYSEHYVDNLVEEGHIQSRTQCITAANLDYTIAYSNTFMFSIFSGLNLRIGVEEEVIDRSQWFETRTVRQLMLDPGMQIGFSFRYRISEETFLKIDRRYNLVLWRYGRGGRDLEYPFTDGTSKQGASVLIGFGKLF